MVVSSDFHLLGRVYKGTKLSVETWDDTWTCYDMLMLNTFVPDKMNERFEKCN